MFRFGVLSHLLGWRWKTPPSANRVNCFPAMQFQHSSCCDTWSTHNVQKKKARQSVVQEESHLEEISQIQNTNEPERFTPGQHQNDHELEVRNYIAAIYEEDHKPYVGKIIEVDQDDVHATFLEASTSTINYRSTLKWPRNPDDGPPFG